MTEAITTKEAKDGTEFEAYSVYSMAVLWSMKAHNLNDSYVEGISVPLPLDGDQAARSRFQELRLADAWDKLNAAAIRKLKTNHAEINRSGRDG